MKKLIYADPPYVGQAKVHYGDHPDYAGEVNHLELLYALDKADGFALHLSAPSITVIASLMSRHGLCSDARWMAWVKPFAAFKRNVSVAYAWEPVLVRACRKPRVTHRIVSRDWLAEGITMQRGLAGAKPEMVCRWLFQVMGAEPDDELVDLFPGSGAVTRAWEAWRDDVNPTPEPIRDRLARLPKWAQEYISELETSSGDVSSDPALP